LRNDTNRGFVRLEGGITGLRKGFERMLVTLIAMRAAITIAVLIA